MGIWIAHAALVLSLRKQLGQFLRKRRGDMTLAQFARKLGISTSSLQRLEIGEQNVTLDSQAVNPAEGRKIVRRMSNGDWRLMKGWVVASHHAVEIFARHQALALVAIIACAKYLDPWTHFTGYVFGQITHEWSFS